MVPVVVVNSSLNSLGVIRSLAHGRMPIYLVATTRRGPAAWSRYCHFERIPSLVGRDLVDGLIDISRRIGQRPVLILTSDAEVQTLSSCREEIAPYFRLSLPSKELVRTLADKTLFQTYAEREGFPVPQGISISDLCDLALLKTLALPVVIKPGDKTSVLDGRVERAVRADTLESADAAARRMLKRANPLLIQEWIEGADTDIYFTLFVCDSASRATAIFSGRKLVCDPPAVGNTAVCVAAPEIADELETICEQFIARVGYQGIGSIEFKRDARDGKFMIVEPTVGRTDWQEEIATLCGINIPVITYATELGHAAPAASAAKAPAAWCSSFGHRLPRAALPRGTQCFDGYFRLNDPLPGLYYYFFDEMLRRVNGLAWRMLRYPERVCASVAKHGVSLSNRPKL
jgi:predicted ATP-grasp superfamily ATP-dependent carboligase